MYLDVMQGAVMYLNGDIIASLEKNDISSARVRISNMTKQSNRHQR